MIERSTPATKMNNMTPEEEMTYKTQEYERELAEKVIEIQKLKEKRVTEAAQVKAKFAEQRLSYGKQKDDLACQQQKQAIKLQDDIKNLFKEEKQAEIMHSKQKKELEAKILLLKQKNEEQALSITKLNSLLENTKRLLRIETVDQQEESEFQLKELTARYQVQIDDLQRRIDAVLFENEKITQIKTKKLQLSAVNEQLYQQLEAIDKQKAVQQQLDLKYDETKAESEKRISDYKKRLEATAIQKQIEKQLVEEIRICEEETRLHRIKAEEFESLSKQMSSRAEQMRSTQEYLRKSVKGELAREEDPTQSLAGTLFE